MIRVGVQKREAEVGKVAKKWKAQGSEAALPFCGGGRRERSETSGAETTGWELGWTLRDEEEFVRVRWEEKGCEARERKGDDDRGKWREKNREERRREKKLRSGLSHVKNFQVISFQFVRLASGCLSPPLFALPRLSYLSSPTDLFSSLSSSSSICYFEAHVRATLDNDNAGAYHSHPSNRTPLCRHFRHPFGSTPLSSPSPPLSTCSQQRT